MATWEKQHAKDIDHRRLAIILNDLRLPAIKHGWPVFAERADKEGCPAATLLATFAEHEIAERDGRRFERHLVEARLPLGKPLGSFDFEVLPMISKAHVMAICAGHSWLDKGANLILVGGPGGGKISTHLRHRPGLIENAWRVRRRTRARSKRSNKPRGHVEGPSWPRSQGKPIDAGFETEPASARTTASSGNRSDAEPACLTQGQCKP